jgi:signal transduction histidine kinase/ligand-binding sensor domain-containing protein
LNPALDVGEYAHTAWKVRDGFVKGAIGSIAQTPDGYLWLGTEFGLLRFDGVRTAPWQPPAGQHLPSNSVFSLLASRDGTLWIGTSKGLASWKNGQLTQYPELAGQWVRAPMLQDSDGAVWVGGVGFPPPAKLCAIHPGSGSGSANVQCYGEDGGFVNGIRSVYQDRKRNLWVGVRDGLWRWKPGPPEFFPAAGPGMGIQGLAEADGGALLFGPRTGIRQLVGAKIEQYPLPNSVQHFTISRLLRDRDGDLWIGTSDAGLAHVHNGRTDVFAQADGLSGDYVSALFEDREGSLWVGTHGGLDRFRELAAPTLSFNQGLSSASVVSVLADRDGSVWLSTRRGLEQWNNGRFTLFGLLNGNYAGSLFQDRRGRLWASTLRDFGYLERKGQREGRATHLPAGREPLPAALGLARVPQNRGRFVAMKNVPGGPVYSITEDGGGNLWIANKDRGLIQLLNDGRVQIYPWAELGHDDIALSLAAPLLTVDPQRRGTWVGFYGGGIVYFADGRVRASYSASDGLGQGRVNDLRADPDGTLWASTEGGLSRLKNGRLATLSSKNGLPCDSTNWTLQDDDRSLWLYMTCGLVRIARPELDAWAAAVDAPPHPAAEKDKDTKPAIQARSLDSSDGVRTLEDYDFYSPHSAKSADGRLWFLPSDGASVVDPRHLPFNRLMPPVRIEQVAANRKNYDIPSAEMASLRLPALVRDLEIDYTALSLVAPEKNRFRYKLEGYDRDWIDAGNRRQAFYTNLSPSDYRFRVAACNNSGVWNEAGASFDFSIAPAYYQTAWFRASCAAAVLALFWLLYRYRVLQIAREFNARLEERVYERTRIARELHDTLLQSFHGLMFRFQAARNIVLRRPEEAVQALDEALERTEQAIAEGRDAIQGLRASTVVGNELAQAITALGEELAGDSARFHVVVQGPPRDLHPILRDEVYAIAREAVRNAFRHAQARDIEADITYNESSFQLRIRDDGKGIQAGIVAAGRAGHYGVPGMRERATRIGGKLDVWTGIGAGTEIELSIPGSIAYPTSPGRTVLGLFRKARGRQARGREARGHEKAASG